MKNDFVLKIYILPQSLLFPEWSSLLGDKYRNALPFKWEMTNDVEAAQVIVWDGMMTAKSGPLMHRVEEGLKTGGKLLILQHEAYTLFRSHPYVESIDTKDMKLIELSSANLLPEDMLGALDECYKKLHHV